MKIPFERTIATAYRFAFRNIVSIIGVSWLPMTIAGAIVALVVLPVLPGIEALISEGKNTDLAELKGLLPQLFLVGFIVTLCFVLATAMMTVGVIRKALGILSGPVYIYLPFDSQVWRLLGAYFLLWLVSVGLMLVVGIIIAALVIFTSHFSEAAGGVLAGVLVVLGFVAGLYAGIRVQFFLAVVVVAENHIGLGRSWFLGRGNFWRILGILIIMTLPLGLAVSTISNSLLEGYVHITPSMTPAQLFASVKTAFVAIAPLYIVLQLLYMILMTAIVAISASAAYRFVTGGDDIAPPPPAKA